MAQETRSILRKTGPRAALSTTNPTWTELGLNPALRDEGPFKKKNQSSTQGKG